MIWLLQVKGTLTAEHHLKHWYPAEQNILYPLRRWHDTCQAPASRLKDGQTDKSCLKTLFVSLLSRLRDEDGQPKIDFPLPWSYLTHFFLERYCTHNRVHSGATFSMTCCQWVFLQEHPMTLEELLPLVFQQFLCNSTLISSMWVWGN